jgi:2-hydroxychromene-2-carboxylate isomerase
VLAAVADSIGLNGAALLAAAQTDAVKARLRANTEEVIARGGYGSPTILVDGTDMYFGNDQLPLIEAALKRAE